MVLSARRAAPGGAGWARGRRAAGGRELCLQGGKKRRVNSQNQNQTPKVLTVAEVPTPAAPGAGGEGLGSSRPIAGPARSCAAAKESGGRAREAKIRPPCRRLRWPPLSFPGSGPEPPAPRWPGPGPWPRASRPPPLRRQASQPPGGGAPMAEPAPAASGAPAPRLTGAGRGVAAGAASPSGERRPGGATRSLPLPSRRSFGFAAGFREGDRAGAAPGPEVCPGSRAAGSWRARRAGQRPAAPRAGGRGSSDPGAGRQCRRAGPEAPGVAGPALPGGCGPGEPADPGAARVCGVSAPRAPRSWRAPGQLAAAGDTETPQRTGSPARHPRSCPRNLAPSEQDTLGRFIASQPSRVGRSEPRAMHGRRRSHGPT
ncbi:translation initiation factor IF-2-like [Physeter macrocephalus]|uniref:Translation initiation factor IF-2-like n=1 Tax=Physeter macrocephalus TaxID=9755 RepID=A0A455AGX5_PHYMC|nr:translation initiation factor IF-2-like [Physeter catodon]|eukprot:XP_028335740.1 uncharacterized protein LOC114484341 [Physeter catodon]